MVSFTPNQEAQSIRRNRWSPAAQVIGFKGASQKKKGRVVCDGIRFCMMVDQLTPASDAGGIIRLSESPGWRQSCTSETRRERQERRVPSRSGMFRFFLSKSGMLCFCQFISNHCVCRNPTTLQIGNTHEYTVRRQICCLSRASVVIVVVSGPSTVSVVFRLVRSWLFCNSGFWLRLFVARFWLVDVGSTWTILPSVVLGRGILGGPLERWGAGRLFHRGIRLQAAAASCTHASCSGRSEASGMGANAVERKSTFLVFSK